MRRSSPRGPIFLATALVAAIVPALEAPAQSCTTPIFADWSLQLLEWLDGLDCEDQAPFEGDPCFEYTYVPHPGGQHNWPATSVRTTCTYDRLTAAGAARAVMIRSRNCPFPYNDEGFVTHPSTIDDVLAYVPDMEFVFMDLEGNTLIDVEPNVVEVVARARAVNPSIPVGNYAYYPGTYDPTMPFESQSDRTNDFWGADLNAIYLTSGLDVAMPSCYPYSSFLRHELPGHYSGSSPNVRAALFWAPIERLSNAKRNLPAGHMLIPWIAPFIAQNGYDATPPTVEDVAAIIRHFRFRGADAFYAFSPGVSSHPDFDVETYLQLAKDTWVALDVHFGDAEPVQVLNTATNKEGGVEWSGIRVGNAVSIVASNLSGVDPAIVDLPDLPGLPDTASVPDGEHVLLEFVVCPADFDASGGVDFVDLLQLLSGWGACDGLPCVADIDGDFVVGFNDLLILLAAWGPCS